MASATEDLLKSQDVAAPHQGSGVADIEPYDDEGPASGGGGGPLGGLVEAFSLFCIVPQFWRLAAYAFLSASGGLLPAIFYLGPLTSQAFGDNATSISLMINAGQFAVAIFGAPMFGMWSDGRSRKTSMIITALMGAVRLVPFVVLPPEKPYGAYAIWISSGITIVTSPFCAQLSGSPVQWAWMTDVIPQEHRETGFSLISAIGSFSIWSVGSICSLLQTHFEWDTKVFVYVGAVLIFFSILVVVTMPATPMAARTEELDPLSQQKSCADTMLSPFRLVARKRSLRLICGLAAFVTLPDVAVTYVAQPIVFVIMGISGSDETNPGCQAYQAKLAQWFSNFPNIFLIMIYAVCGVFAKRYGPARMLAWWTPISCILFAAPAFLAISGKDNPAVETMAGLAMTSPLTIYPPLQAIVALLVPPSRVGEAMGAVAASKNVASLCAPLIMQAVILLLGDHYDLYWTLFPGAAIVMLFGATPFAWLLHKRLGDGTETEVKWSVWSSASGSVARSGVMGSRVSASRQ